MKVEQITLLMRGSVLLSAFWLFSCQNNPDREPGSQPSNTTASQAANDGLKSILGMVKAEKIGPMSEITIEEGSSIDAADSIPVFYADLKKLMAIADDKPQQVLVSGKETIFPVKREMTVDGGLVVKKDFNAWKFTGVTRASYSGEIDSVRNVFEEVSPQESAFLLKIPELYLAFVAVDSGDDIKLQSMTTSNTLGVEKDKTYKASALFKELSLKLNNGTVKFLTKEGFEPRLKE